MPSTRPGILSCIGRTPLLPLRHLAPRNSACVLLKVESHNPTGSMKDRTALAMIEAAEADGRLPEGRGIVEYTGGSTGVSLALICGAKGIPLRIVSSDAFARAKLDRMRLLGAKLTILPSDEGRMTAKLTRDMIAEAGVIARETGSFWADQMKNRDQFAAYETMADEIWVQTAGRIDAFVQSVGTAASFHGMSAALKRRDPTIQTIAVEPAESAVLSGGVSGAHRIDGIGAGYVVPLWRPDLADGIERVSTEEARQMALWLAREERLFAGPSTGCNVVAALRLADRLGPKATIVTIMCDTSRTYLRLSEDLTASAGSPSGTSR